MVERVGAWRMWAAGGLWLLTWPVLWSGAQWISLWPSAVALAIVFLVRRVITGLLAGAMAGVLLLTDGNPATAFVAFFQKHTIPSVQSDWRVSVLMFTLLLGGFAGLVEHGGGFRSLFRRITGRTPEQSRRRVQGGVLGMGAICFFDGLTNSLLVGRTMRPLADRAGLSREKLSFLVDTTSSAVACVAIISTWIATQLSLIEEGFRQAGGEVNPYAVFLRALPYNYYCWFVLALAVIVVARNWNIGPMRAAEARAAVDAPIAPSEDEREPPGKAYRALLPLLVLVSAVLGGLYLSGAAEPWPISFRKAAAAFGAASAPTVLVASAALACLVAFLLNRRGGAAAASDAFWNGVISLFVPVVILISAWILSSTLRELGAASYLTSLLNDRVALAWLPLFVFLLAMLTSFTTGTSWGTMGILLPLTLPVAVTMTGGGAEAASHPVVAGVIAAVFGGAVFGDHCSPLSDTTIVSSISCGLEPMDHVRTQLPYALLAAGVAIVCGYALLAVGAGPLVSLPAGLVVLIMIPLLHQRKGPKDETSNFDQPHPGRLQ